MLTYAHVLHSNLLAHTSLQTQHLLRLQNHKTKVVKIIYLHVMGDRGVMTSPP